MKSLTRRELLFEVFTKDTLKSVCSSFKEFKKSTDEANRITSCEDAGRILGEKNQKRSKQFFNNIRKEG